MKNNILASLILLFSMNAIAGYTGIYGYEYWYPKHIEEYLTLVNTPSNLEIARQNEGKSYDPQVCAPVFAKAFAKNELDIRYALGYFDDSTGNDIVWDGKNYGKSASLDIEIFFAIRENLMKPCQGNRVTCGFREHGDPENGKAIYTKNINLLGRNIEVFLTMTYASASNNYQRNKTELRDRQSFLTAQSDDNLFGGLTKADIIFYNGHSRNGGGPDFNPPILDSKDHTDYDGYYKVKRPGIKRALEAIKKNPNQGLIYGSFSCFSASHFQKALTTTAPKIRMILSSDTIDYLQSLKASMGYLEGLMQGRCGEDLAQFAKRENLYGGFKGVNIK